MLKLWSRIPQIDFIKMKNFNYGLSLMLFVLSLLLVAWRGLNFGIEFTGGVELELRATKEIDVATVRHALVQAQIGEIIVQHIDTPRDLSVKIGAHGASDATAAAIESAKAVLGNTLGSDVEYRKVDIVGPQVGKYLINSGIKAMTLSFLAIAGYIWVRFEWQFGLGVLLALVHDAVLSLGFMSLTHMDFNLSSIAALLTIIGYSVNDSVVIYDRVRTNLRQYASYSVNEIINLSVNQTLSRTTLTVFSTLIANLALIVFGGGEIRSFSVLVFFGIIAGTYSSIFISAPILTLFKLERFR